MILVDRREVSVVELVSLVKQIGSGPASKVQTDELLLLAVDAARAIKNSIDVVTSQTETLSYASVEELFAYAERVTDFFIFALEDNFRWYTTSVFPEMETVSFRQGRRATAKTPKRASGHVTGTFAEAMSPWILKQLKVPESGFFRLGSLSPGVWGQIIPDLVLLIQNRDVPCEIKHYASKSDMSLPRLSHAVMQVVAGVVALDSADGYLVAAIAQASATAPYRVEVIHLAAR